MDALWRSLGAATQIAAMAVLVDAKDQAAEDFYAHFGFIPLQQQPARLFLPMKTVAGTAVPAVPADEDGRRAVRLNLVAA